MNTLEILSFVSIFIYVSLWEYMLIMYKINPMIPYNSGYNLFSVLQWPIIGAALVHIYGWIYGMIAFAVVMMFLQYITHFTLGWLYSIIFKNPLIPLALFVIMFWINIIVTITLFVVN